MSGAEREPSTNCAAEASTAEAVTVAEGDEEPCIGPSLPTTHQEWLDSLGEEMRANRRVMVFRLNAERQWDDKGTGILRQTLAPSIRLLVRSESSNEVLLEHSVSSVVDYVKQGDSIVTWFDPVLDNDVAVSFQEAAGCDAVWDSIQTAISKRDDAAAADQDSMPNDLEVDENLSVSALTKVSLPLPTLANLESIATTLATLQPSQRYNIATITEDTWLKSLFDVLDRASDLEEMNSLHQIFRIVKNLFLLNTLVVLELLVSDEFIDCTVHALEYDPDLPSSVPRDRHRKFIHSARFKDVVPIEMPALLSKIRQTFIITYIRDVILLRHLDDATVGTLNSMYFFNTVNVISPLANDAAFIERLINVLDSHADPNACSDMQRRCDLFKFLHELCSLSKNQQLRTEFFQSLANAGLFRVINKAFCSSDLTKEQWLFDILGGVLSVFSMHDAHLLRLYMISECSSLPSSPTSKAGAVGAKAPGLLSSLVHLIVHTPRSETVGVDVNRGFIHQIASVLMALLDPESLQFPNQRMFVSFVFVPVHVSSLLACMCDTASPASSRHAAAELVTFVAREHALTLRPVLYRLPQRISVQRAITVLMGEHSMELKLVGVRFVRGFLRTTSTPSNSAAASPSTEGDATSSTGATLPFVELVASQCLLAPVIAAFLRNGQRYNLLNSAVIELLEHIRQMNIKVLVAQLVENHFEELQNIKYVNTFAGLQVRYQQNKEVKLAKEESSDEVRIHLPEDLAELRYFSSEDSSVDSGSDAVVDSTIESSFVERRAMQPETKESDFMSIVSQRRHQEQDATSTGNIGGSLGGGMKARSRRRSGKSGKSSTSIVIKLVDYREDDEEVEKAPTNAKASPNGPRVKKRIKTQ